MTHDELLEELDGLDHSCSVVGITVAALRVVVDLHKPIKGGCENGECCEWAEDICSQCDCDYPCPTIQAIEKEIK